MEVAKSTRHAKIAGNFGEALVLYWLSKHGFECAMVDHTGIDIIACNRFTDELMGISVKSRTRNAGKGEEYVRIPNDNFTKMDAACEAFACKPYFAIVVDADETIRAFLLPRDRLLALHPMGRTASSWAMRRKNIEAYENDPAIKSFTFRTSTERRRIAEAMARIARVVAPSFPHHITQRGNLRQATFFGAEDSRTDIVIPGTPY